MCPEDEADGSQAKLFDLAAAKRISELPLRPIRYPVWTENKAKLIERYLYYFVLVTRHGTYIDAFAGPQEPERPGMWAAKLVLSSEPRWLRHFYLFERSRAGITLLKGMVAAQPPRGPREPKRQIEVRHGDSNRLIWRLLQSKVIRQKEATFCLVDQRTFECEWKTLVALAAYKTTGPKIEVFYFLANSWFDRALSQQKDIDLLRAWWGQDGWECLRGMPHFERATKLAERFRDELGYASAKPYPIYERKGGGRVMYYMIHATDHPEAQKLMYRAYHKAVTAWEPPEQLCGAW